MKNKKNFFYNTKNKIYCFADNLKTAELLLKGGAKIIQFREKTLDDNIFFNTAVNILSLVKKYDDTILIINDRVNIAIEIGADGVHIGQEDESFDTAIQRVPKDMIVGVSAKTIEQAIKAENTGATYLGCGAIFPSSTKKNSSVIGIDGLKNIIKAVKIPVVAIGGININNIGMLINTGAKYFAVISGINNSQDIPQALNNFIKLTRGE
ncbi:MAG: thiamine phosphate synthase [Desulfobacterales bacterium]|nr:thiamine phosphate synthase [Desulfobacterales bacterium]